GGGGGVRGQGEGDGGAQAIRCGRYQSDLAGDPPIPLAAHFALLCLPECRLSSAAEENMKLGLYMATQWRQGADLGPELANLIEQVRVARASGLDSLMVGQHFVSTPLQMFQAMPLLARPAAAAPP